MNVTATSIGPFRLGMTYTRYQFIERLRSPISLVLGLGMPAMTFLFFIAPQRRFADDPTTATAALVAFCVFGVMSNSLFGFAVDIAQAREKAWGAYLRSLPGSVASRLIGYLFSVGTLALLSIVPVILAALLTTSAQIPVERWSSLLTTLIVTNTPFMLMSSAIGFLVSARTAIALVQVLMLGFAFGGGLFLPPAAFPDWLDVLSTALPSRSALELTLWSSNGGDFPVQHSMVWLAWMIGALLAALASASWDRTRHRSH